MGPRHRKHGPEIPTIIAVNRMSHSCKNKIKFCICCVKLLLMIIKIFPAIDLDRYSKEIVVAA